jgi:TatD DNase family protein
MFVDTHCHITMMVEKYAAKGRLESGIPVVDSILKEADEFGVRKIVSVSTNLTDSIETIDIAKKYESIFATVGIHPGDCSKSWRKNFSKIEELAENKIRNKIVAIGETGLDFFHKPFDKEQQIDLFVAHIECAIKNNLPVIVHIRESADEVLEILERYRDKIRGVAHCFMQDRSIADRLIELDFYLGVGGPITYPKNSWYRELAAGLPLENLVLETDAPFLPPQPFRGKTNHPKNIKIIAEEISKIKKIKLAAVEQSTTANALKLFFTS